MARTAVILQLISIFFCCVSGAFLQYGSTRLSDLQPNVTLTVGATHQRVYCAQATGPVSTSIEWYNPQGQLVSRNNREEVNHQATGGGRVAVLTFRSYQQNQGGKYECRVTGPGNNSETLPVRIVTMPLPIVAPLPGKVMGVRVTPGVMNLSPTLTVTWQSLPEEAVTYTVKYSTQLGEVNTPPEGALNVTGVSGTSIILTALERGTTYYNWVVGVSEEGEGPHSDRMSGVTFDNCCSECSSIQSTMFVSFEVAMMKVDESDSLVHIDVFRYGPMSDPITLRVRDIPLTAKRVQDYSLQSSSLVFLNTERMVERSTVVVRIREDSSPEQDPPTESFRLVLSSSAAGEGMQPAVVFSVPEMEVHIRDNDY